MKIIRAIRSTNWRAAWFATKWLCFAIGGINLLVYFITQTQWLLWIPSAIGVSAIWYAFYRLRVAILSQSLSRHAPAARREAGAAPNRPAPVPPSRRQQREDFVTYAPKHPLRVYSLLENGREVAEETNKRAIENWLGLGEQFDAVVK